MAGNTKKQRFMALPIERHETAAWTGNFERFKPISNVGIPTELDVDNSKEWVDSNQK